MSSHPPTPDLIREEDEYLAVDDREGGDAVVLRRFPSASESSTTSGLGLEVVDSPGTRGPDRYKTINGDPMEIRREPGIISDGRELSENLHGNEEGV